MQLRLSRYCLVLDDVAEDGRVVVHDLLTDTGVLVRKQVAEDPGRALAAGDPEAAEIQKCGMLFDVDQDPDGDRWLAEYWLSKRRLGSATAFFTYVLTLHCNLKCTYCYQAPISERSRMTPELAQKAADWSIRVARANGVHELIAIYFGGEPMLEPEILQTISGRLKAAAVTNRWSYRAKAVTNGTLLTPELVDSLADAGLSALQVTLDGPAAVHDLRRIGAGGQPTYQRILDGIRACRGRLQVTIRVNVDRQNLPELSGFLETLGRLRAEGYIASVDLAGVMDPENQIPHCQQYGIAEADYASSIEPLYDRAQSLGLPPANRVLPGPCPAVCDGSWVISPAGELYRCHHLLGDPRWSCGNIQSGEPNHVYHQFVSVNPRNSGCTDCPYMPVCYGGCRYRAIVEGRKLDEASCYRKDYDHAIPVFLKTYYRHVLEGKIAG